MSEKESTTLTVREACDAADMAIDLVNGAEDQDELDEMSNWDWAQDNCPEEFTKAQCDVVHHILLEAYMKSIGK